MATSKHPRSERTIYPKNHTRPLKGEHFEKAKDAEKARAKADKYYMTAEEARALPAEIVQRPEVQDRIRYSQGDWPESKSTATRALGPLKPGEGETVQDRATEAAAIFEGGCVGDE